MGTENYIGRDGGNYVLILTNKVVKDNIGKIWAEVKLPENEQIPCYWGEESDEKNVLWNRVLEVWGNSTDSEKNCERWASNGFYNLGECSITNSPLTPVFVCCSCFQTLYRKVDVE